jgi:hypothetical protein
MQHFEGFSLPTKLTKDVAYPTSPSSSAASSSSYQHHVHVTTNMYIIASSLYCIHDYQGVVYFVVVFSGCGRSFIFGASSAHTGAHTSAHNPSCDLRQRPRWSRILTKRPAGQNAHIKARIKAHMKARIQAHMIAHIIAHIKAHILSEQRKHRHKQTTHWYIIVIIIILISPPSSHHHSMTNIIGIASISLNQSSYHSDNSTSIRNL